MRKVYENFRKKLLFAFLMCLFLNSIKRERKSRDRAGTVILMQHCALFYPAAEKHMVMESIVQKFYCCGGYKNQQQ